MRTILRRARLFADIWRSRFDAADISFFHTFVPPPYGGGNQFLRALWHELERRGWKLENNTISPVTRACVYNSFNFDFERLRRFRRDGCRMVHRVDGPISVYRGTDDAIDRRIWEVNQELSDATIFQSEYSRRRHEEMGLPFKNARVIHNAADPDIFHARGRRAFDRRKIRVIATSWSDNPNKGAEVYAWLEQHLDWTRFDFTFIGRSRLAFSRIRALPPLASEPLADELRAHDIFISASQHESCSNALIEALSCGLPCLCLDSGGNAELVGEAGFVFHDREELPDLLDLLVEQYADRQARIAAPRIAAVADAYLEALALGSRPGAA